MASARGPAPTTALPIKNLFVRKNLVSYCLDIPEPLTLINQMEAFRLCHCSPQQWVLSRSSPRVPVAIVAVIIRCVFKAPGKSKIEVRSPVGIGYHDRCFGSHIAVSAIVVLPFPGKRILQLIQISSPDLSVDFYSSSARDRRRFCVDVINIRPPTASLNIIGLSKNLGCQVKGHRCKEKE